ncbi:MAG: hypothetical protein GF320_08755 [Armatimonadia bacterium]|nr:hypothetical protein [Armatimonadia bacterium]
MATDLSCDYCGSTLRRDTLPEACPKCGGPVEAPPAPPPEEVAAVDSTPAYDPWDVWYLWERGRTAGPYPVHMICAWVRHDQIGLNTRIASARDQRWRKLADPTSPPVVSEIARGRQQALVQELHEKTKLPPVLARWVLSTSGWTLRGAIMTLVAAAAAVCVGLGMVILMAIGSATS